jgi:hypothetical protein
MDRWHRDRFQDEFGVISLRVGERSMGIIGGVEGTWSRQSGGYAIKGSRLIVQGGGSDGFENSARVGLDDRTEGDRPGYVDSLTMFEAFDNGN